MDDGLCRRAMFLTETQEFARVTFEPAADFREGFQVGHMSVLDPRQRGGVYADVGGSGPHTASAPFDNDELAKLFDR